MTRPVLQSQVKPAAVAKKGAAAVIIKAGEEDDEDADGDEEGEEEEGAAEDDTDGDEDGTEAGTVPARKKGKVKNKTLKIKRAPKNVLIQLVISMHNFCRPEVASRQPGSSGILGQNRLWTPEFRLGLEI